MTKLQYIDLQAKKHSKMQSIKNAACMALVVALFSSPMFVF